MSLMSNLDLIRRVPLFSMLTNEQAQSIADAVREIGQVVESAPRPPST